MNWEGPATEPPKLVELLQSADLAMGVGLVASYIQSHKLIGVGSLGC